MTGQVILSVDPLGEWVVEKSSVILSSVAVGNLDCAEQIGGSSVVGRAGPSEFASPALVFTGDVVFLVDFAIRGGCLGVGGVVVVCGQVGAVESLVVDSQFVGIFRGVRIHSNKINR